MKKIFAANWKMFKTPIEARSFFKELMPSIGNINGELIFFPDKSLLRGGVKRIKKFKNRMGSSKCLV